MNWTELKNEAQIDQLNEESKTQSVLIFKHSTSCSISRAALGRLERNWKADEVGSLKTYYLDLLSHRAISNRIAARFGVEHESPQVLIIQNGKPIYTRSHFDIAFEGVREAIAS